MAKTTKTTKAAEAALDAAAAAAKDAKRLSKTLPKKDAKKLRALADDAKDASQASKKKVANQPRKVHKKAVAAIARVDKAVDKAEAKLAAAKKSAAKKGKAAPAKGSAKEVGEAVGEVRAGSHRSTRRTKRRMRTSRPASTSPPPPSPQPRPRPPRPPAPACGRGSLLPHGASAARASSGCRTRRILALQQGAAHGAAVVLTPSMQEYLDLSSAAPAPRTLIDILRETSARHPQASALEDAEGALSYAELLAHVGRTAARLHSRGVRRGDRVGVRMPSGSRDLYVAILGIMAAGAAYVPVDADDPPERAELVFRRGRGERRDHRVGCLPGR